MVKVYSTQDVYNEPPHTPLLAYFIRYPNPFARHVLSVDVLERRICPETGRVFTKRLILKRGIIPKWASKWLSSTNMSGGRGLDAWVVEHSVVDPPGWGVDKEAESSPFKVQQSSKRSSFFGARAASSQTTEAAASSTESASTSQSYRLYPRLRFSQANLNHRRIMHVIESGELCATSHSTTVHHTTAEVKSDFGGAWSAMVRQRIEAWGISKFEKNSETSRKGMSLVMTRLRSRQPLPDTAEFYPPPPPQFSDQWPARAPAGLA